MNNIVVTAFFVMMLIGCDSPNKVNITETVPDGFQMYKTSEMAALMRQMLSDNKAIRNQVLSNKALGNFNSNHLNIHTARLTDTTQNDVTFSTYASYFIAMEKELYNVDSSRQIEQFNKVVDACIACHKDRCTGPIPIIRTLKISAN